MDDDDVVEIGQGSAEPLDDSDVEPRRTRGVYVPDLSSPTGWTWISLDDPPPAPRRPAGFRLRG